MKKYIYLLFLYSSITILQEIDKETLDSLPIELQNQLLNQQLDNSSETDIETENSLKKIEEDKILIFGFDFFNEESSTSAPVLDIPLQSDYLLSFNDEIELLLVGGVDRSINSRIDLSGNIVIPDIGAVNIVNLPLSVANKKISAIVSEKFVGTESFLSVRKASLRKISIVGAVNNPGTYIVNPFISLSESIKYASGLKENASIRTIVVKDYLGNSKEYDLYNLLVFGDRASDANLKNGDTVVINATSNFVEINGGVHRPMIYEYKKSDTYMDLINFALGLNKDGVEKNISSVKISDNEVSSSKINLSNKVGNYLLEEIFVGTSVVSEDKGIFIDGYGVTNGYFSVKNSFEELLNELRFSENIYPFYAIYEQKLNSGLTRTKTAFSIADPDTYKNLSLTNNSRIFFYDRDYIANYAEYSFELLANTDSNEDVNSDVEIYENNPAILSDYIQVFFADENIEIPLKGKVLPSQIFSFFEKIDNINFDNVAVITNKLSYSNAYNKVIDSDELVAISFPSEKQNLIEVEIQGEIKNPGKYIISSSTSLSDLYMLVGGLNENAFEPGISLFREDVKQKQIKAVREAKSVLTDAMIQKSNSISERGTVDIEAMLRLADLVEPTGRVAGKFYENSESSRTFLLKNGDSIFIPSISNEVVVQGEVLNSSSFIFDESMNHIDYIEAAGGFSDYADKRSVFIIKANGLSSVAGSNIFSGQIKIEPGDTIVVPRNLDQLEPLPLISMATKIIADIAFSAASLNAIQD